MLWDKFKNKLAVVPLEGTIMGGGQSMFSPLPSQSPIEKAKSILEKISDKKRYRGLVLVINSPGGSPFLSKELGDLVEDLDLYSVACIKEIGASGGYWVACSCDEIVCDELSTVGGVGTLSIRPDLSDFLEELGIDLDVKSEGRFKEFGLPFLEPSEEEENQRERVLEEINNKFKQHVMESRGLSGDEEVFEGKVYLGEEAKEEGLVDYLGDKDKAIDVCVEGTGYSDLKTVDYKKKMREGPSLLELIR